MLIVFIQFQTQRLSFLAVVFDYPLLSDMSHLFQGKFVLYGFVVRVNKGIIIYEISMPISFWVESWTSLAWIKRNYNSNRLTTFCVFFRCAWEVPSSIQRVELTEFHRSAAPDHNRSWFWVSSRCMESHRLSFKLLFLGVSAIFHHVLASVSHGCIAHVSSLFKLGVAVCRLSRLLIEHVS